ncbi:MAG: hypothetical protein U0792_08525 [Gemmataceae bacterium]
MPKVALPRVVRASMPQRSATQTGGFGRKILEIDYDTYAQAKPNSAG